MTQHQFTANEFWIQVEQTDGCWLWVGKGTRIKYQDWNWRLPTLAYHLAHGSIPQHVPGFGEAMVHQVCRNPLCVRPDHLYVLTGRIENGKLMRFGLFAQPIGRPTINTTVAEPISLTQSSARCAC